DGRRLGLRSVRRAARLEHGHGRPRHRRQCRLYRPARGAARAPPCLNAAGRRLAAGLATRRHSVPSRGWPGPCPRPRSGCVVVGRGYLLMRSRLLVAALVLLAVVSAALATVIVHRLDEAGQPAGAAGGALIGGPFDLASTAGGRAT